MLLLNSRENLISKIEDRKVEIASLCAMNADCDELEFLNDEIDRLKSKLKVVEREISFAYGRSFLKSL